MKSGYRILWTDHALTELEKQLNIWKKIFQKRNLLNLPKKLKVL